MLLMQVIAEHFSVEEVVGIKDAFDMKVSYKRGKTSYGIEGGKSWSKGFLYPRTFWMQKEYAPPYCSVPSEEPALSRAEL